MLAVVLVEEVEESRKVKARKDVAEATAKELSRRARKERAKMDRRAKQQEWRVPTTYGCEQCAESARHHLHCLSHQNNNGASSSSVYRQAHGEQSPVQPKAATVRRIFHITPPSSYPSSPASPASSRHVRMVEFLDSSDEDMHVRNVFGEEWIILDSGSDASLLPARFSVDSGHSSKS